MLESEATVTFCVHRIPADTAPSLHQLVEMSVAREPGAPAICFDSTAYSRGELNAISNRFARALVRRGIGRGSIVAMCADRSIEAVALSIAIAKCGAAFVPLEPSHPSDLLQWTIGDAAPNLIVADDAYVDRIAPHHQAEPLRVSDLKTSSVGESSDNLGTCVSGSDLAYIIYTSGSSGRPKGVMVEHASAANMLISARDDIGITVADRVLFLAPFSFDPSIWQTFGMLAAGACIVVAPPGTERDPVALARVVVDQCVSIVIAVPTVHSGLLDAGLTADTSCVRTVVSGGSVLTPALRARLWGAGFEIFNVYGPTEGSIHTTSHRCTSDDPATFVPLGKPVANTRVYVLADDLEEVGAGHIGEICLAGAGLARGYFQRPSLTAERFVTRGAEVGSGERIYRTGDLARLHGDGNIEFIGRNDTQVKIFGLRVELGEVEAILEGHAQIEAAAVVPDAQIPDRLVAYVVPREARAALQDIVRYARGRLAAQAVPSQFIWLDAMPLLASGKIDRQALPTTGLPQRATAASAMLPTDSLAAIVHDIWCSVLGRSDIGANDDFFLLGGDSMQAARVISLIEERLASRIALGPFYADPTMSAMIRSLREAEYARYEPSMTLSQDGSGTAFFYLHGDVLGLGAYCRKFAGTLGRSRPIYAIAPHGADGGFMPPSVELMARDHLEIIRARQPRGPYLLGGYCIGAIVAFEVARQLEAAGDVVASLVLVEAQGLEPPYSVRVARRRLSFIEDAVAVVAGWIRVPPGNARAWYARQRRAVHRIVNAIRPRRNAPGEASERERQMTIERIEAAQEDAVLRYVWRPVTANATMLCARSETPDATRIARKWEKLFRTLDVSVIPGNHDTVLGAHISELVDGIDDALEASGI